MLSFIQNFKTGMLIWLNFSDTFLLPQCVKFAIACIENISFKSYTWKLTFKTLRGHFYYELYPPKKKQHDITGEFLYFSKFSNKINLFYI